METKCRECWECISGSSRYTIDRRIREKEDPPPYYMEIMHKSYKVTVEKGEDEFLQKHRD